MTDSTDPVIEPVTRHDHDVSWSANLEQPQHAADRDLVIEQASDAIEATANGTHVNLVTHGEHGHPETYLWEKIEETFADRRLEFEYVDQCGCGGHVTRVHVGGD